MPIISQTQLMETQDGVVLQARDLAGHPDTVGKMWCYVDSNKKRIVDHSMVMHKIRVYSLPCLDITVSNDTVFMALNAEDVSRLNFDNKPEKILARNLTKNHFIQCETTPDKHFAIDTTSAAAFAGIGYVENCQYIQCPHSGDRMYYYIFSNEDPEWIKFLAAVAARGSTRNGVLTINLHDPNMAVEFHKYLHDKLGVISTVRNGSVVVSNSILSCVISNFVDLSVKYGTHLKKPILQMTPEQSATFLKTYLFLEGYSRWSGDSSSKCEFFSHRLVSLSMAFNVRQLGLKCNLILPIISTTDRGSRWYKINTCGANTRRLMNLLKDEPIEMSPINHERGVFNKGKYYARVFSNEEKRDTACVIANTTTPIHILSAVIK